MKKSNFITKHSIVVVLLSLFFVSCSDNLETNVVSEDFNVKNQVQYETYAYNGGMYTAGEIHNMVLDHALLNSGWESFDGFEDRAEAIVSYIEEKEQVVYPFEDYDVFNNSQAFIDELNNNPELSSQEYRDLVNNMQEQLLSIESYDDIDEIVAMYKIELKNSSLNNFEYDAFSNGLSVLESSVEFWSSYTFNGNRDDGCGPGIAMSDWGGAVTGAMFGGPAFVLSGLVGAAVSSAIAALPCL